MSLLTNGICFVIINGVNRTSSDDRHCKSSCDNHCLKPYRFEILMSQLQFTQAQHSVLRACTHGSSNSNNITLDYSMHEVANLLG